MSSNRPKKTVFAVVGSASAHSSNEKLVQYIAGKIEDDIDFEIYTALKSLPPFDPTLSEKDTPLEVLAFRSKIQKADAVLICTPEYIFSIPSGLKNAFEWCVSTTVFSLKPTALITASANGQKGHEELQLIAKTLMANFKKEHTLLISGVKGKIDRAGEIRDISTKTAITHFLEAFKKLIFEQ
ncbi:NAD(P)H-dependent oxidoreductase [Marinilongibacter aquaticus]|uniref:NADPH-dependent FMN reductase n=1 Tax=Marinilongibacter aquaticus TaxID=2975157 RepID=UPI0021BDD6E7|nr:NADPH-dependent FMN reductase [Marinilongibacter aquaticus]UBM59888.1 NAD(P)H-dependent oxidoreductase [Marinilongibacter aquaticus]